jgi:hypothetical protein
MTSIIPVHRHSIPAMDRESSTAAAAPSTAAVATSGPRPTASPHRIETATIPVQITVMVILIPPLVHLYGGNWKIMYVEKPEIYKKIQLISLFTQKFYIFHPNLPDRNS